MRIRFTWQPNEWQEAVQLASTRPRQHRDMPMMAYGILGIMSLGAVGDLFQFLQSRQVENPGAAILLGGACTAAAGSGLVWLTRTGLRKRRIKRMPQAPEGEQQAVFQETGWKTETANLYDGPKNQDNGLDLRPWRDLHNVRTGPQTLVVTGSASAFTAIPLRALTADEAAHLQRLFARKLKSAGQNDLRTVATA